MGRFVNLVPVPAGLRCLSFISGHDAVLMTPCAGLSDIDTGGAYHVA